MKEITECVGAVEDGRDDENPGVAEVGLGDVSRDVADDEGETEGEGRKEASPHAVEENEWKHEKEFARAKEEREGLAEGHNLGWRRWRGGTLRSSLFLDWDS